MAGPGTTACHAATDPFMMAAMISTDELARLPPFAAIGARALEHLARHVADIQVEAGEYVVHEGDARALIVVVDGAFEVTKVIDGVERVVTQRGPGEMLGEVPIALNTPFLTSLRATRPSRVVRLEPKVFHTVAADAPALSAAIGAAALERIGGLQQLARAPSPCEVLLVGPPSLPALHRLRSFLHRNQVEFDTAPGDEPRAILRLAGGALLVDPSKQELARALGLSVVPARDRYDVVIVGGGPAGMAAAVYAASEGLATLVVEREAPGGQAGLSARIENYLGFPHGVSGDELATRALKQARRLGAEIVVTRSVEAIDVAGRALVLDGGQRIAARTTILATGVSWRRLAIPSLDRLTGRGVFYGDARSEAASVQGRDVFLVGAGNSAGQAAVFLASHARAVTLVVRGDDLAASMSHYLIGQLRRKPNIEVRLRSEVVAVHGADRLEALDLAGAGGTERREAAGLFVFIGADAATGWLPPELARDERGFVLTGPDAAASPRWPLARAPHLLETTVPGIFAAGDLRSNPVKRVASAVGDGSLAIAFVHQVLASDAK